MLATTAAGAQSLVVVSAPKFENYISPPVSAAQQMNALTGGNVRLAVQWDAEGRPVDWMVIAYSRRDFADSVVSVIPEWRFVPSKVEGQPVSGYTELEFEFKGPDIISLATGDTMDVLFHQVGFRHLAYRPCPLRELDRIPMPLNSVSPLYGLALLKQGIRGSVEVRFYIDETGAVRLPAVVSADHPQLAEAALTAVRQWKFEPPTSRGNPVLILAQQRFDFGPGQPKPETMPAEAQAATGSDGAS